MSINAYLFFDGDCREAFGHYESVLGGKMLGLMPYAGSPACANMPPDWHDKIMHACLQIHGGLLMGSDAPPGHFRQPQGFAVHVAFRTPEEAERVFAGLGEGGQVCMAMEPTFWAHRFGLVNDRFGTPWMVSCPKEDTPDKSAG